MTRRRGPWGPIRTFDRETPALVGIINRKKDWRLLAGQHWYRIPVRSAPEGLPEVRYLAWYQTSVFGDEKWAVNWYARVLGLDRVRRVDLLPDEGGHKRAHDAYYRVDVGDLLRLPNPIPSRSWRRIVFIPTSLERLLVAREINDLFHTSPIEDRLYYTMRDQGLAPERQFFVREAGQRFALDMAVFCRDGNIDIECDGEQYHAGRVKAEQDRERDNSLTSEGWHILRFSGKQILDHTGECMRVVRRTVRRLGGQRPRTREEARRQTRRHSN